jgi:excinuclease UvrABC nuclease subunit
VLARFGTLREVCDASLLDLEGLPGIGPKRAESIVRLFNKR